MYHLAQERGCYDVTTEDPTDDMNQVRDDVDVKRLQARPEVKQAVERALAAAAAQKGGLRKSQTRVRAIPLLPSACDGCWHVSGKSGLSGKDYEISQSLRLTLSTGRLAYTCLDLSVSHPQGFCHSGDLRRIKVLRRLELSGWCLKVRPFRSVLEHASHASVSVAAEESSGATEGEAPKQKNPLAISPSLLEDLRKVLKINKVRPESETKYGKCECE